MGFVVYWYDFVCFGIVGVAFVGSLYVIWREGAGKCEESSMYETDLVVSDPYRPDIIDDGHKAAGGGVTPRGHVSTSQLWTSCWRGLHPVWLLALRFASFLITSGILVWDITVNDLSVFIYYTEWTFTLVVVYFAIGTIVSAHGCMVYYSKKSAAENGQREGFLRREESTSSVTLRTKETRGTIKLQSQDGHEATQLRAGFWGYLMQTAYQTCAGAVLITDLVFWCLIVPFLSIAHFKLNRLMGCTHTLNAVLLLLDTAVNSLPFPWFRLAYFVLWSCCYVTVQWIIHACGYSMWPYPFIELSSPWAPLWYFCLAVAHIPCYGLYWLLIRAKNSFFSKLFPHSFVKTF